MAQTNQNTFPDGFPLDPYLAIDFSYFLSEEEKQEWRDWLQNADDTKKKEFVETLHAMWLDNQKNAVPDSFNKQQSPQPPAPAPQQAPTPQTFPEPTKPQPAPQVKPQANPKQPAQEQNNSQQTQSQTKEVKDENENIKLFGQTKYSPNPLLDDDSEDNEDKKGDNSDRKASLFGGGNSNKDNNQKNQTQKQNSEDSQKAPKQEAKKPETPKPQKPTFKRIRETGIKKALEDIYQQYLDGREKTFTNEREYVENHSIFLDKVMRVVVNFEDVLKYFDSLQEKMLEMNDKIIKQSREIDKLNNQLKEKSDSLEYHLNEVETNLQNTDREVRKSKIELAQKYKEVSEELSGYGADSFKEEGLLYRLDQILDRLEKLEETTYKEDSSEKLSIRDRIKKIQSKDTAKTGEESIFRSNQNTNKQVNGPQNTKNDQEGLGGKINSFFNQKQQNNQNSNSQNSTNQNTQQPQNTKSAGTIDLRGII